jgi:hypothetical protein
VCFATTDVMGLIKRDSCHGFAYLFNPPTSSSNRPIGVGRCAGNPCVSSCNELSLMSSKRATFI